MRRFFIVISILFTIILLVGGVLYYVIQQQLRALPVDDLSYRISGLGYKHIRLEHVRFTYVDHYVDNDSDPSLHAPVEIDDAFVTWNWANFRPRLQIIEVDRVAVSLNQFPQTESDSDSQTLEQRLRSVSLPDDWRLSGAFPHRVKIRQFELALPCTDDPCHYSGQLEFDSENSNPMLRADQPQRTEFDLTLSPHARFQYREQINVHVIYEVNNNQPALNVVIQTPDSLHLEWDQRIDRANRLHGDLSGTIDPTAGWIIEDIWRWLPDIQELSSNILQLFSQRLTISSRYQTQLPASTMDRWLNELSGTADAAIELHNAVALSLNATLERDDTIDVRGEAEINISPAFYRNLNTFINGPVEEYLNEFNQPVTLATDWSFSLPPGTMPDSWLNQADGRVLYALSTQQSFVIPDVGATTAQSRGEVRFSAGQLMFIDALIRGTANVTEFDAYLDELNLDPGLIHWSAHVYQDGFPDRQNLPLHLELQSAGETNLSADLQLLLNTEEMALRSNHALLNVSLDELDIEPLHLRNIRLNAPFVVTLQTEPMTFSLHSDDAIKLSADASYTDTNSSEPVTYATSLNAFIQQWQWQGDIDQFPSSSFAAELDIALNETQIPALTPLNWRWQGHIEGSPMAESGPLLDGSGRLTNDAGLLVRAQYGINLLGFTLDWQMADIFWLAGNPFARMLDDWPEILTLERGRTRASGQLSIPRLPTSPSFYADIEFSDVAGIVSTATFSGLRSQIRVDATMQDLSIDVTDTQVQRIQYGFTHGPGDIALRYETSMDDLLGGTVDLHSARLNFLNGELALRPDQFSLDDDEYTLHVDISRLDIARLFTEYPVTDLQGSGLLSGQLPIQISSQGIFVDSGQLAALPPGGQLSYRSDQVQRLGASNQAMALLFDVLDDFHYSELAGGLSYRDDGWLELALTLQGQNPTMDNGHPVRLEITLEEDLPALLRSLQLANQLNDVIQERVQQFLIQRQREQP